jgi:O-antigen ligase
MSERSARRGIDWDWLRRQVGGLLIVTYVTAIGGTLNGLVSPRLRILSLGLLVALGVAWLIRRGPRSGPTTLLPPLLGLCVVACIATIFSPDPRHSSLQLGYWGAVTVGYWVAMDQMAGNEARLRLTRNIQLTIAGVALFAVWEIVTWPSPGTLPRVSSIMGSPNIYGGVVLIGIGLAAGEVVRARGARARAGFLAWLAFLAVMLIMSGSRAAWLGAAVGGMVFIGLATWAKGGLPFAAWRRWIGARPLRAGVGLGLAALLVPAGLWLVIKGISAQAAHYTHAPFSDRLAIWGAALAGFTESPLTGVGPFRFAYVLMRYVSVPPEQPHAHAHNLVLQIMAEDGLIGLAGLIWLGVALSGALRRAWAGGRVEERLSVATAAGLAAALLAHNMLDFVLLPSVALAGLWAFGATLPPDATRLQLPGGALRKWVAPILLILTVGLLAWPLPGAVAAQSGTQAAQVGDWPAAAAEFDEACRLDPGLVVYQFDAAYAYGQTAIAGDDPSALARAVDLYRAALAREPEYSLHWANLAVLEMHASHLDEAREHMQHASALAPDEPAFAQLADVLARGQVPSEPGPHPGGLGTGPRYGLYLFHVVTPDLQLLPLPAPEDKP